MLALTGLLPGSCSSIPVEVVANEVDGGHLRFGDRDTLRAVIKINVATDHRADSGGRRADQIDDHAIADQRLGTPVRADDGERAVLDLVHLAAGKTVQLWRRRRRRHRNIGLLTVKWLTGRLICSLMIGYAWPA
jgi:hypothetical protein